MNQRRTAKMTLKSSWRPAYDRAIQTFQDAQESKIFKTSVTNIKIKCPNNFLRRYSVEITYTSLELSENFIMHTPQNRSFQARKSLYK